MKNEAIFEMKQGDLLSGIDLRKKRDRSFHSMKISMFLTALYGAFILFFFDSVLYRDDMHSLAPLILSVILFVSLLSAHFYFFRVLQKLEYTDSIIKNLKHLNTISLFVSLVRILLFGCILPVQIVLIAWAAKSSPLPGQQPNFMFILGSILILSVIAAILILFGSRGKIRTLRKESKEFKELL